MDEQSDVIKEYVKRLEAEHRTFMEDCVKRPNKELDEACDKNCPNVDCNHIINETHAKNKIRRNRKFRMIKEKNGRITMCEVPNNASR